VGYTGGNVENPTYELVCSHTTGHAEAVEVTYDPERVSYDDLLDVFWMKHNPTTKNRQGLDIGSQYRSAVFFHSPEQEAAAIRTRDELQEKLHWPKKIVTEIVPATEFYEAEDYHQQYLEKRGRRPARSSWRSRPSGYAPPSLAIGGPCPSSSCRMGERFALGQAVVHRPQPPPPASGSGGRGAVVAGLRAARRPPPRCAIRDRALRQLIRSQSSLTVERSAPPGAPLIMSSSRWRRGVSPA
jgi:peptide-methionine (S)-S-oxide reductase